MTRIARLTIYPIKSLDGMAVAVARALPSGALENDRRFALQTPDGKLLNGKRTAQVQRVRAEYRERPLAVTLTLGGATSGWLQLPSDAHGVAEWTGRAIGQELTLQQNDTSGLPDDLDAPGPTVISLASLLAIGEWFGLPLAECRRRFRANIEIDAPTAFWEDRLVGKTCKLGPVEFQATGVCQRCVVPARDSRSGEPTAGFQKAFAGRREATLPAESPRDAFNHFYRAALNTRLVGAAGTISVGDPLAL